MKNYMILMSFLLTLASCQVDLKTDEGPSIHAEAISKEEALDLLHRWTNAYLEGDAATLDEILDDSWVYSGSSDGNTTNKLATIAEFSAADYRFDTIAYEDLKVNLYDDIAVVRGAEHMVIIGDSDKDTIHLSLRFTDIYQKKTGVIRAISTHSSPIEKE